MKTNKTKVGFNKYGVLIFTFVLQLCQSYSVDKFSFLMPNVKPNAPDLYLCTPVKIDPAESFYIVGFDANATMSTSHHIILYGCTAPGSSQPVWDCGEMTHVHEKRSKITHSSPCSQNTEILYAWAMDAPKLILPDGVGFKVGKDTSIQYLVLQVHYSNVQVFEDGRTDDSGIILHYTKTPLPKLAGVYLLGSSGLIPPHSTEYLETACPIEEDKVMHPFAYRTHTHALGKVVAGYVIKPNNTWYELGKRDPLTPQMFYPVQSKITIETGDRVAARCTMHSNRDRITYIGATKNDEMCNFYLMYYVEQGEPMRTKYCYSPGPPNYYWQNAGLTNIPEQEASTL